MRGPRHSHNGYFILGVVCGALTIVPFLIGNKYSIAWFLIIPAIFISLSVHLDLDD